MFGKGKLERVVHNGNVIFEGHYWPESDKSCEAHDRAKIQSMQMKMTPEEIEQYEIDHWNDN